MCIHVHACEIHVQCTRVGVTIICDVCTQGACEHIMSLMYVLCGHFAKLANTCWLGWLGKHTTEHIHKPSVDTISWPTQTTDFTQSRKARGPERYVPSFSLSLSSLFLPLPLPCPVLRMNQFVCFSHNNLCITTSMESQAKYRIPLRSVYTLTHL